MFDRQKTGKWIQELRKQEGYTQEELAQLLHISTVHLGMIETGKRGASIDLLIDFSEHFGVSIDFLILGKRPEYTNAKNQLQATIDYLTKLQKAISSRGA